MKKVKKLFSALAAAAFLLMSDPASATEIGNDGYIEVEGLETPEPGESINDARRIAVLEAYRLLGESVGELHISSTSTLNQAMKQDGKKTKRSRELSSNLNTNVDAVVQGAVVKNVYKDESGTWHAIVRLPVFGGQRSLANAVLAADKPVEDLPEPVTTGLEGFIATGYTGLVIDCSGLGLSTAITPAIKNVSGQEVYTIKNVTRQMAAERGMVGYSDSLSSGTQRAGSNPLVVKAMFISGECDVVVSDDDGNKILAANQNSKFLNNCMVVFVR